MTKFGIEIVDGIIIGGSHMTGQLFYEGRPQSGKLHGDSDDELREEARKAKQGWKDQCGEAFSMIYPNNAWELRIFN